MFDSRMFFLFSLLLFFPIVVLSQTPAPSPSPPPPSCNSILLTYNHLSLRKLPPETTNSSKQPFRFESTAQILNNGLDELQSWRLFIGFQHDEFLVSATNAVLADGTPFPANTTSLEDGAVFAGFPISDLKTAVETAGDLPQMEANIDLVGTVFGVESPLVPMPKTISLVNDGFSCPSPTMQGDSTMYVCCVKDPTFRKTVSTEKLEDRQKADLVIMYDILRSYDSEYTAQVSISNYNPLTRLDYWKLSWTWMRQEFISTMKGAYPSIVDSRDCLFGPQGIYCKDMDFANVLNCQRNPTIVDLPLEKTNDSTLGGIPFCCRNGTILPPSMDPSRSTSIFQLTVKKMPPYLNRTDLAAPQNFQIKGTPNAHYKCESPGHVTPSLFPDSSGLLVNKTAVASWQVLCNITQPKDATPKCCVSFSAFYDDSVIPCKTCACGCPKNPSLTCNTTAPARLLPPDALLVPFDNRTEKDNCGVSINWHVNSDYAKGWSARITLFNWGETSFVDWFVALQFRKAVPGFEKTYSFNGTALNGSDNTIFMHGLEGLNYLVGEVDGSRPEKDPRVPGKQQSVISFSKKNTPGLHITAGDGFPRRVIFNGEECLLPGILPSKATAPSSWVTIVMCSVILILFY
ncbi:hypothetical protein MKW98_016919 [Papaver atlanticum]|uniref:COBRA C-terminal domain-containing protein n=1 Tax=Papaver atlanticum TaxID=357466 RepID=A0AAD4TKC7_9MAGN|nr:hypothetical protein MKW98_016919 [Papaver atlanticum]